MTAVVDGVRAAAEEVGLARIRAARHRVEHAEMLTPETIAAFAELGLTASVQPAFDALWGGEDGMYAQRLGPERARTLNPFAALLRAGVPLAFGSDSPVTPLDPWGTVRAAAFHRTPGHRVSVRAAFTAHTRGGWRAVGRDDAGVLVPGAPADYALWRTGELVVQAPDDRVARWSTDPRSGTPDCPTSPRAATCPSACARWSAGVRSSYGRASDLRGRRGDDHAPRPRLATCASSPLTRHSHHITQVKRLLTGGRRGPVGSPVSTTGRPTGERPATRVSAAGSGTVCRTGAPSLGARLSGGAVPRDVPAGRGGATPDGARALSRQRLQADPQPAGPGPARRAPGPHPAVPLPLHPPKTCLPTRSSVNDTTIRMSCHVGTGRAHYGGTLRTGHEGAAVNDGDGTLTTGSQGGTSARSARLW
ncbi:hypothetical protein SHKM778_61900 [Streptomyces sp. KM77-8]|uniref:Amidohydrolase 3 domain-containing protein n=1 Tax=Streptomyces haneummycinicus TaxID=3074435 RepID=A0AAT9HQP5_9ACTN